MNKADIHEYNQLSDQKFWELVQFPDGNTPKDRQQYLAEATLQAHVYAWKTVAEKAKDKISLLDHHHVGEDSDGKEDNKNDKDEADDTGLIRLDDVIV